MYFAFFLYTIVEFKLYIMEDNILGFMQAPNYLNNSKIVKAPVKEYIPYVYKCIGTYAIGKDGFMLSEPISYK